MNRGGGAVEYTKTQAIKLWKPYISAFIFSFIVYCLINEVKGFYNIVSLLFSAKWEIFFLQLTGFDLAAPAINGVTAYIPALLTASLLVYYFLSRHYRFCVNIAIPLFPVFIYSHIVNTYGNLSQWLAYENWYTIGILRGLAGLLVGAGAYIYCDRKFTDKQGCERRNQRYFGGLIGLMACAALVFWRDFLSYSDEILYPYIFSLILGIVFFREKKTVNAALERLFLKLGKISYNIFLVHYGICYLFLKYYGNKPYREAAPLYMLIVVATAVMMDKLLALIFPQDKK